MILMVDAAVLLGIFFFSFVWFRIELVENCETLNGYGNEEACVWQLMAYTKTWEADKLSRVSFGHMVPWETVQTGDVFTVLILTISPPGELLNRL